MNDRRWWLAALPIFLTMAPGSSGGDGPAKPAQVVPKKILVELYTSQGCRSCPPASDLLGRLARMGYGPDRVVAVNFHLDGFDDPWADPYANPHARHRQDYYNEALRRRDLAVAPLMVVDGREVLVGSDPSSAMTALARASREPAGVSVELNLVGDGPRKSLSVRVVGRSPSVEGRELLVGVALVEDPVTTRVGSGENAGRTLVEHQVVRRFAQETARLNGTEARTLTFPFELVDGQDPTRSRVSAFVQDRRTGAVHQAESIPWPFNPPPRVALRRKKPRPMTLPTFFDLSPTLTFDPAPSCPDCGTPYSPEYLASLPPGFDGTYRGRYPNIPAPKC